MKTGFFTKLIFTTCCIGFLMSGCEQATSPFVAPTTPPAQMTQSIDKEPPGVHFLPLALASKMSKGETVNGWSGVQTGWESQLCSSKKNTWVGSDTTTYGNAVRIWHDAFQNWDTMTVTVRVVDNTTFGAVDFYPSVPRFYNWPEVHLNYANFGISDAEAKSLVIYWWDPERQVWSVISNKPTVQVGRHRLMFRVPHFSRYAFGRLMDE